MMTNEAESHCSSPSTPSPSTDGSNDSTSTTTTTTTTKLPLTNGTQTSSDAQADTPASTTISSDSTTHTAPHSAQPERPGATDTPINVAIETDIGHDCDDIEALQVALKDHKLGYIKIVYICTVSRNNKDRAKIVQHLCAEYGIDDIVIVVSKREEAAKDGQPLDRCTMVYNYQLVDERYSKVPGRRTVQDVHPGVKLCQIVVEDSVKTKQELLRKHGNVRLLIIGPGVEAETLTGLVDPKLSEDEQREDILKIINRIVWQGNYNDKASFNIGSDFEPVITVQAWADRFKVPHFNIGKLVAYNTQLDMQAFGRLAAAAKQRANVDLAKLWQLGVMEFRDAALNLFNCLNYKVSTPGEKAVVKSAETFDENNPDHQNIRDVLTQDSFNTKWFKNMPRVPPMYDVTAYFLLRDAEFVYSPSEETRAKTIENGAEPAATTTTAASIARRAECKWYHITTHSPTRFSVGAKAPDIKLERTVYLQTIESELMASMLCLNPARTADFDDDASNL